jgi:RNA polymerase sigma factor (sigma-70 family)
MVKHAVDSVSEALSVPNRTLTSFLEEVRHEVALQECGPLSDPDLLERFVSRRDETAFAALVARHGPMVFGVCRRLLERTEDAEDASQATFLVLARKAAGIRKRESLPSWLHGVASRVARKSRADILRKRGREAPGVELPQRDTLGDVTWREALAVLDEELNRLPENYRSALILCYLEGKTQDEAARELGWSLGALRGRLERGRERLRTRVSRRGISLATVLLGAGLSSGFARAAVSRAFVTATAKAATIFASRQAAALVASARAAALAKAALATMRITKVCVAALLFTACIGFVVGAVTVRSALRGGPEAAANGAPEVSAPGKPETQAAANEAPEGPAPGKPVWQPRAVIGGHFGSQCYVELAPDGKTLVTFNPAKSDLAFWDVATWKERAIHPLNKVFSGGGSYSMPLFSPDGKVAVAEGRHAGAVGRAGPAVALFDVMGGKVRAVLPGGAPGFSPDGKLLAVSTADAIALYDAATAKERLTFPVKGSRSRWTNHHGRRFSPDGKILATAQDGVVRLWDTATGKELATLSGYLPVTNHEMTPFSPDGKTLVTAEKDRTVRLWDVSTGKERAALTGHKVPYIAAIFSPDGKTVATLGTWYGVQAGAPQQVAPEESFLLRPVEVKLWDTGTGKANFTLPGNTYHDDRAQFSSDGKTLAYRRGVAGEQAQCVVLWDIVAGKELAVIPGDHVGRFSPDGKLLLVQSPDGGVTFRDTVTGQVVSEVQGDAERQVSFLSISRVSGYDRGSGVRPPQRRLRFARTAP